MSFKKENESLSDCFIKQPVIFFLIYRYRYAMRKLSHVLEMAGQLCYDTRKICHYIHTFFTMVASNLLENCPQSMSTFSIKSDLFYSYTALRTSVPGILCSNQLVLTIFFCELCNLNPQKSTGLDDIAPKFVRYCA